MSIKKYSNGQWVDTPYRKYETATDTITTLPKSIIGDSTNASAVIKGNMQQTGTPTPASPIYPTETGDKTANLFDKDNVTNGRDLSASTGNLVNGQTKCVSDYKEISENTSYTTHNVTTYVLYNNSKEYLTGLNIETGGIRDVTIDNTNAKYIRIACEMDDKSTVMLNTGSTVLPYQPYGYKLDIKSANTITPVYLGEVQSTRRIRKLVLTGDEDWYEVGTGGIFRITISDYLRQNGNIPVNTHYKGIDVILGVDYIGDKETAFLVSSSGNNYYYIADSTYGLNSFKAFLAAQYAAGTPVTVWYVLATPTTGIVNEPLRKIGNYADSVSVTGIPTTGTAEQFDVDTTLAPSEVSLTYHGWHEHSDTKF